LAAVSAGHDVEITSMSVLDAQGVNAGGDVGLFSGASLITSVGSAQNIFATSASEMEAYVTAAVDIGLTAFGGSIKTALAAGNDASVHAGTSITASNISAGGSAAISASGPIANVVINETLRVGTGPGFGAWGVT
jgi:hypothetical protein